MILLFEQCRSQVQLSASENRTRYTLQKVVIREAQEGDWQELKWQRGSSTCADIDRGGLYFCLIALSSKLHSPCLTSFSDQWVGILDLMLIPAWTSTVSSSSPMSAIKQKYSPPRSSNRDDGACYCYTRRMARDGRRSYCSFNCRRH
jgi:hypothetical protein